MSVSPQDENTTGENRIGDASLPSTPSHDPAAAGADALAEAVQEACADGSGGNSQFSNFAEELAAEQERVLRLQAEMENLRSRTAREIADAHRYAPLPVVRDLLPVVDNIDRAIDAATKQVAAAQQTAEAASLLEGFQLVRQQLMMVLQQHQCRPIDAVGQPFDPQIHQAILQQPSDEQPANHVLQETQTGYQLHDRVVRASQVIISSGPADTE